MIVVDSSVLVLALAQDDEDGDRVRARLRLDGDLHAPHIVDLEVISVLRRALASKRIDERRAQLALSDLRELRLRRYPHVEFAQRVWELRNNLTPYDAVYAVLASELGCPLVTADIRLAKAPRLPCSVEVLP